VSAGVGRGKIIARAAELGRMREVFAAAAKGRGGFVLIRAGAGIGKTALVDEGVRLAGRRRFRVIRTRATRVEEASGDGVFARLWDLAGRQDGAGGGAGRGEGGEFDRLLADLASAGPVAIALDDAQWCEPETLRALLRLAPWIETLPIAVLIAARDGERGGAGLLDALAAEPNAETILPGPLSEAGVATLFERRSGASPEPEFARACHLWTGGNPFLATEVAVAMERAGVPPAALSIGWMRGARPPAVAADLALRLGRLGSASRSLASALALLAVDGEGVETAPAARLAELPQEEASAALEELIAAGIARVGPPLEFAQPLLGALTYDSLPAARRGAEHGRAAALLAEWGAGSEAIARHLVRSDPTADPTAVAALRESAARELSQGAPAKAAGLLRRALREPPPPAERYETLLESAAAEDLASRPDLGEERLREALLLAPDDSERSRVANTLSLLLTRRGQVESAGDTARRELEAARAAGADEHRLLELEVQLCVALQLGPAGSGQEADERLERLAPQLREGASAAARSGLAALAFRRMARGDPAAEAIDLARRALEAGLLEDPEAESGVSGLAIGVLVHCEAGSEADLWLDRALARARERGAEFGVGQGFFLGSLLAFGRGDLVVAGAHAAAAAAATGAHYAPWVDSVVLAVETDVRLATGELRAAEAVFAERGLDGELPPPAAFSTLLESRGRLRLELGQGTAGLADLDSAGRRLDASGMRCPGFTGWRSSLAVGLRATGEEERARELAAEELALARGFGVRRPLGIALRTLGLIEGGEAGIGLLEEAVETLAASQAELERARTLVELGAALRRSGRRADARRPLRAGLELATGCGAAPLVGRARDELRASGGRLPPTADGGVDALTPSEVRICRLAAAGNSNPAIASRLFVTRATVESHLHASYRKLGITSRAQLAAALAEFQ
jgi:DNA-binding CsgD family transcriptional regulator/tetratricopeptide (TPR) repeat protein